MWKELEPMVEPLISLATRGLGAVVLVILLALIYFLVQRALGRLRERGKIPGRVENALGRILRATVLVVGLLLVLQQFSLLEYAWTTLSALLAMVAIGFVAVWSVLSNALCALILLIARPFDEGDNVEFVGENVRGQVTSVNMLFTTVRDADDETRVIQIPNNLFFQKMIRRRPTEPAT
jgi:small-conductance mechanosensitive channel